LHTAAALFLTALPKRSSRLQEVDMGRFSRVERMVPVAAIVALATASCGGDRPTSPRAEERPVYSAVGIRSTETAMRARLERITRAAALALSDAKVRTYVYQQLRASPYREHKLHFAPFVAQAGSPFAAGIAAAAGLTTGGVNALLDSIIDLEFYMPVKAHWARWAGGPDLIVASAFRDHEIPVAFDLQGAPVVLTSAQVPPPTPTLGIVPRETDFSRPEQLPLTNGLAHPTFVPCDPDCGGPPPPTCPPGVCMTFSYIPGDYEGFLMGDPEFEVHALARRSSAANGLSDWQCAGEHAATAGGQPGIMSSAYAYDQNGDTWYGAVLLASKDQANAAQAVDSAMVYLVLEDDNTACVIVKDAQQLSDQIGAVAAIAVEAANAVLAFFYFDNPAMAARSLIKAVQDIFSASQNDDIVGIMVEASKVGVSYSDATHAIVQNVNGQLQITGRARLTVQP